MQNLPENYNILNPTAYRLDIDKLPLSSYWAQSVQLPGAQLGEIMQASPFRSFPIPGDNLAFDIFDVMFLIDEDMGNWNEIYQWMRQLSNPKDPLEEFAKLPQDIENPQAKEMYSDGRLHIMTNSMNPNKIIEFTNIFPTILTPITMESTDTATQPILGTVSFVFHDMQLIK